jgi:ABC-type multidrug transport system ATPase subunit
VLELFCGLRGASVNSTGLADGFLPAADAPVRTLSGGQRQRLAIAIALLGRPRLLLLDEPTANLDAWARAELRATLEAHRREGTTVLIASPRRDEVPAAGDVVLELDAGSIVLRDQATVLTVAGGSR